MTTDQRFGETKRTVTFMGLDVVTDWFGEAAAPALIAAFERAGGLIARIADAVEGWNRRRATWRALMALDDRLLDDIGIARGDIPALANGTKQAHRL